MKMSKVVVLGLSILSVVCLAPEAKAQTVNPKTMSKANWNQSPREFQIIDDRPIIKDFREPPVQPQGVQLPPPPQGFGGPGSGGGGGAMGDGGGGSPVMPSGGMPMAGGGPGYRTDNPGMGALPLPKSGFGRDTNIPAGGMGPKTMLPSGQTTGVHGSLMTPTAHTVGPASAAGTRGTMTPARPAPVASSYGGNYTRPMGGSSASGSGASTAVRGVLLNRLKK